MNKIKSGLVLAAGIALTFVVTGLGEAAAGWLAPYALSPDLRDQSLLIVWLIVVFFAVDLVLRRYPARARAFLIGFSSPWLVVALLVEANDVVDCTINSASPPWSGTWWRACASWGFYPLFGIVVTALFVVGAILTYRDVHRTAAVRLASA